MHQAGGSAGWAGGLWRSPASVRSLFLLNQHIGEWYVELAEKTKKKKKKRQHDAIKAWAYLHDNEGFKFKNKAERCACCINASPHKAHHRHCSMTAWEHGWNAGWQGVCGRNSRLSLVCSTDPSCLAGPLRRVSPLEQQMNCLWWIEQLRQICALFHTRRFLLCRWIRSTCSSHNSLKYTGAVWIKRGRSLTSLWYSPEKEKQRDGERTLLRPVLQRLSSQLLSEFYQRRPFKHDHSNEPISHEIDFSDK